MLACGIDNVYQFGAKQPESETTFFTFRRVSGQMTIATYEFKFFLALRMTLYAGSGSGIDSVSEGLRISTNS